MSVESAQQFLDTIAEEQKLSQKVARCKNPSEVCSYAATIGFSFTEEELKEAIKIHNASQLEESELDEVVGGSCWTDIHPIDKLHDVTGKYVPASQHETCLEHSIITLT